VVSHEERTAVTRAGTGPTTGPRRSAVASSSPTARRAGLLCGAIAAFNALTLVGDLLSPTLLAHRPVLLVLLSPRTAYLVAVADDVPFPVFFAAAFVRLSAADPLHFLLGRTTGPAALTAARRIGVLRRVVDRLPQAGPVSPLWLVGIVGSPTAKTMCAAGAAGLPARGAAAANVAGTAARILVIWSAGRALPQTGQAFASVAPWLAAPAGVVVAVAAARHYRRTWRPREPEVVGA
jgi:hypothetical protein